MLNGVELNITSFLTMFSHCSSYCLIPSLVCIHMTTNSLWVSQIRKQQKVFYCWCPFIQYCAYSRCICPQFLDSARICRRSFDNISHYCKYKLRRPNSLWGIKKWVSNGMLLITILVVPHSCSYAWNHVQSLDMDFILWCNNFLVSSLWTVGMYFWIIDSAYLNDSSFLYIIWELT